MCSSNYPSFDRWRMEMLIIDDGDNGGDQGGRSCGSAVAVLRETSGSQRKVTGKRYFVANSSFVGIYTLLRRFSGSFQKAQQCCCRYFKERLHALLVEAIMLSQRFRRNLQIQHFCRENFNTNVRSAKALWFFALRERLLLPPWR